MDIPGFLQTLTHGCKRLSCGAAVIIRLFGTHQLAIRLISCFARKLFSRVIDEMSIDGILVNNLSYNHTNWNSKPVN